MEKNKRIIKFKLLGPSNEPLSSQVQFRSASECRDVRVGFFKVFREKE